MSEWWSICRRNATGDEPDGSCPECRHASKTHPGIHNNHLTGCVVCALDHLDGTRGSAVSLLTGMTPAELDEIGGVND